MSEREASLMIEVSCLRAERDAAREEARRLRKTEVRALAFLTWAISSDFIVPESILVCAGWNNLLAALAEPGHD